MAVEGATLGQSGGDARRLLLSRLVLEHHLQPSQTQDLHSLSWEDEVTDLLLADEPVSLAQAGALLAD